MKASELIKALQEQMEKHGDLPVRYNLFHHDVDVEEVDAFDKDGAYIKDRVEFYLF